VWSVDFAGQSISLFLLCLFQTESTGRGQNTNMEARTAPETEDRRIGEIQDVNVLKADRITLCIEWLGLSIVLALWVYLMYVFFNWPPDGDATLLGLAVHAGPTFRRFFLQQTVLLNVFILVNAGMMLVSVRSRMAHALVGFYGVHEDTHIPLICIKAIFFSVVTQASVGFGSQYPVGSISMLTTTVQIFMSFILTNQFIYANILVKAR